ncbi:2-oxo-hepta-3-ene-1,7-dioate hydratase [Agrococcus sp. SGAir0287]|nr:2-oxo-hepta-3-ene-1,7-dioate hydratase [Agrococcus sp. SGAir0287]
MTVDDSYAVQRIWRARREADGHRVVGRKIGLTSKVMQVATGISEPDYGVIFDDQVFASGSTLEHGRYANVRVEVELAFVLAEPLGAGATEHDVLAATEAIVPALEVLDSHIQMEGRTIVDTISDNAALGAMVLGDVRAAPDDVDLRWVGALLSRNGEIEDSGVSGAVLGHPARGVAWLAGKVGAHGDRLEAGEIVLAGSFTKPMWVERGDEIACDYRDLGVITCRFD